MDLDSVLKKIGEFGPFQKRLYFLLCLVSIPAAFHNLGYVFWAARPDHWCALPDLVSPDVARLNQSEQIALSIPSEGEEDLLSKCLIYDLNYANLSDEDIREAVGRKNRSESTRSCSQWNYDTSQYKSTIVTEVSLTWHRPRIDLISLRVNAQGALKINLFL